MEVIVDMAAQGFRKASNKKTCQVGFTNKTVSATAEICALSFILTIPLSKVAVTLPSSISHHIAVLVLNVVDYMRKRGYWRQRLSFLEA